MTGRANQPRDLVWSLESFTSPDNAMNFFDAFKNSFLIYSYSVEKLYAEYTTQLTGPAGRQRLVVLPDFNKYESIFNRITAEAIIDTSVLIFPYVKDGKTRLVLSGHTKAEKRLEKLPLKQGLKALRMGYFDAPTAIPTLMLGDLREFPEKKLPYLKLHCIEPSRLSGLSAFERRDIEKGAWAKLEQFL